MQHKTSDSFLSFWCHSAYFWLSSIHFNPFLHLSIAFFLIDCWVTHTIQNFDLHIWQFLVSLQQPQQTSVNFSCACPAMATPVSETIGWLLPFLCMWNKFDLFNVHLKSNILILWSDHHPMCLACLYAWQTCWNLSPAGLLILNNLEPLFIENHLSFSLITSCF